jgi:LuxR family maltose regulon positive regulatory protein
MSTIYNRPVRPEPTPHSGTGSSRHLSVVREQPPRQVWLGRASKFDPAPIRAGALERERLLCLIAGANDAPITLISASAGYGKSTLARQWCKRSQRPVAWINLDSNDNDPIAFLSSIAHALDRLDPVVPELLAELSARRPRIIDFVLPAITLELDRLSPVELVLDDAHQLTDVGTLDVLDLLLDGVRSGTHVTLVTRKELHLSLARRRLTGNLVEIRADDLAFDPGEIRELAATHGTELSEDALEVLGDRTEGWPAGIALSFQALTACATADDLARTISGDQRQIADYLVEVVLDPETEERRRFLLATSVLPELTAQLCDAVVGGTNSAETLAELEAGNSFVIPLDDHRRSYRYHRLFAELLRSELQRSDPDLARECLSRAASWYEQNGGNPGEAFRCALECSDFSLAGRVALASVDEFARRGQLEDMRLWLGDCRDEQIESDPRLALAAASVFTRLGELEKAQRYGAAAEAGDLDAPSADEALSFRSALAGFRIHLAARGVHQMLADAELVCNAEREATSSRFFGASLAAGTARLLLGQPDLAAAELREFRVLSRGRPELVHVRIQSLGYLCFATAETGDWPSARKTAQEAAALSARAGLDHTLPGGIALVARAGVLVHDGDFDRAEAACAGARRVGHLFRGSRWLQADINIRLANISLGLGDRSAALEHVDVSRAALAGYEDPGVLTSRLEELEVRISCLTDLHVTPAEIRILPFLPTHLSIKEIAARLFVSPATVKTHVSSVYGKLDASTRSEAVARMQHLGLHLAGPRLEYDQDTDGVPLLCSGHQD